MSKKTATDEHPDTKALKAIIEAFEKVKDCKRDLADANSSKLKEPKELLSELEEVIKQSSNAPPHEASEFLERILRVHGNLKETRSSTQDTWRESKGKLDKAEEELEKLITGSKQGELF